MEIVPSQWKNTDVDKLVQGDPSTARGRKIAVVEDDHLDYQGIPCMATKPEEVGVVVLLHKTVDPSPLLTDAGAKSFGATFDFVAITSPERVVVAKWRRRVDPDPRPMVQSRTGNHHYVDLGANGVSYKNLAVGAFEPDCESLRAGKSP